MADIIEFAKKQPRVNLGDEPCHKCDKQEKCITTCGRADVWWHVFAKQYGKNGIRNDSR
jgi:hypothetical protein